MRRAVGWSITIAAIALASAAEQADYSATAVVFLSVLLLAATDALMNRTD